MVIFRQGDPQWSEKKLGNSNYTVGKYGCLATCVAQALYDAGWLENPGTVVDKLSVNGGFTDNSYPRGGGLLIWGMLGKIYPQIHLDGQGYTFVQGHWNGFTHWLLKNPDGVKTDPWYGKDEIPEGFTVTGYDRVTKIDVMPAPNPPQVPQGNFTVTVVIDPNSHLNVRTAPSLSAPTVFKKRLSNGDTVEIKGVVTGDSVDGNTTWLNTAVSGLYISARFTNYNQ